jgi:ADP-ribose pyrophosphatase YjhB (NUDIX family)
MERAPPDFRLQAPPGDERERRVCARCAFIDYVNPRIVVGSVVTADGPDGEPLILFCRRAIEPRLGFWTLPAGFMETGETVRAAAMREAREEANAEIEIDALLAVYDVPHISQVQMMFRARLTSAVAPGPESLEVALLKWADIPWDDLAFPSVRWALDHWRESLGRTGFPPFSAP